MRQSVPRIVLAGTGSGCGKTTVVCAVLRALANRGLDVGAFKCGPDYIDPMFHAAASGRPGRTLDLHFFQENTLRCLLARNGSGRRINVIEGVMGYYDGAGATARASTYEITRAVQSPAVLIVGAKGASLSLLAQIQGFAAFYPDSRVRGVILNGCSAALYPQLAGAIRERFQGAVLPLGFLPPMPDCALKSRHLGLVPADETAGLEEILNRLARQAEQTLELDALVELACQAPELEFDPVVLPRFDRPVRIAVARDVAFCFYYEDSLDALRELGAQLVEFSPLADRRLPENVQGLYLGGGYPELYAGALSENRSMRASVRTALERGIPCIAECGGFMYLTQAIEGRPMVGYLPGSCRNAGKLVRFGYTALRAKRDNLLCRAGEEIPGHEFHHWDCDCPGGDFTAEKSDGRRWDCVVATKRLYAGYPHFHFYANPAFAVRFYQTCLEAEGECL